MAENTIGGCTGNCHSCVLPATLRQAKESQVFLIDWNPFPNTLTM